MPKLFLSISSGKNISADDDNEASKRSRSLIECVESLPFYPPP